MSNYQNQDCIDLILKEANSDPQFFGDLNMDSNIYLDKIDKNAIFEKYYVDNNLAGIIAYYCNDLKTKEAYLTLMLVDEDYRGMGISKKLMNSVKDKVQERGFKKINLEVNLKNPEVISSHKRLGYTEDYRDKNSVYMSILI